MTIEIPDWLPRLVWHMWLIAVHVWGFLAALFYVVCCRHWGRSY